MYSKKMLRLLGFLIVLTAGAGLGAEEVGVVEGRVIDAEKGEGLFGARIMVEGTDRGGISDPQGYFRIEDLPVGVYGFSASFVGYQTLTQQKIEIRADRAAVLDARCSR